MHTTRKTKKCYAYNMVGTFIISMNNDFTLILYKIMWNGVRDRTPYLHCWLLVANVTYLQFVDKFYFFTCLLWQPTIFPNWHEFYINLDMEPVYMSFLATGRKIEKRARDRGWILYLVKNINWEVSTILLKFTCTAI